MSEAKCEAGWGDRSTRRMFETRDCHPTPPLISFAATLPARGRVKIGASGAHGTAIPNSLSAASIRAGGPNFTTSGRPVSSTLFKLERIAGQP